MQRENTAFLVMDVQPGIVDRLKNRDEYLNAVKQAVDAARNHHIPVMYIVVGFRKGFPEVSKNNKAFQTLLKTGADHLIEPKPLVIPAEDEVVITKKRISAFAGSDLEVMLSARDIRHLILCGVSTSGVVLSTLRQAADKDFELIVLSDLCGDPDEEVHSFLLGKIFPRQANVTTSNEWIASLD
jgi:nicotinamidase-related amidase